MSHFFLITFFFSIWHSLKRPFIRDIKLWTPATCRIPGIAEVTLQAYSRRHGAVEESPGARCRARAKPIALTIVCVALISLAVYWLIVGPIYESLNSEGGEGSAASGRSRGCDR